MKPAGVVYAVLAYGAWGLVPIYWKWLSHISSQELLSHRVLWTVVVCSLLLTGLRRWDEVKASLARARERWVLVAAALLLGSNWLVFLWAVANDQIIATSLGYYLNPLLSVVLAVVLLGERLRRVQAVAVGIAAAGVLWMVIDHGGLPWISLALAGTFGLYGLAHKVTEIRPIPRLWIETTVLAPIGAGFLLMFLDPPGGALMTEPPGIRALMIGAGPITALPLLWFASAARRLPLSALGLFQYLAPTISLLVAIFLYDEPFTRAHVITFSCIWLALAIYTWDSVREARRPAATSA
jgi:chloramphenicol-sensitive protein RarD